MDVGIDWLSPQTEVTVNKAFLVTNFMQLLQ
jgi:hypothetical protein